MLRLLAIAFLIAWSIPAVGKEIGVASTYEDVEVACPGEKYRASAMAAAHPRLPCGTLVRVTNLQNDLSVVVKINDNGPHNGRLIDLTPAAANAIKSDGLANVSIEVVKSFKALWRQRIGF
jgi:rare lipoprotein A